jgi:methionyl-tRNA formyltransferase
MRFAIATADKLDGVLYTLLASKWRLMKVFTFSINGRCMGEGVAATALRMHAPVQLSRIVDADLQALADQGCEALVAANYRWRIPDWRPYLRYGINFHNSPLPAGRGPWPLVRALQEGRKQWGVSCHKLSPELDQGDIVAQELFALAADEDHDSLDLRCQMGMKRLAGRVALDLPRLWERAQAQGEGGYWPRWTTQERSLDLQGSVDQVKAQLRAFGSLECVAPVSGALMYVSRATAWHEAHTHAPGTLVHGNGRSLVFALKDGYVGLLKWSLTPPAA